MIPLLLVPVLLSLSLGAAVIPPQDPIEDIEGPNPDPKRLANYLPDEKWGREAAKRMGHIGKEALPYLIAATKDKRFHARANALHGLYWFALKHPTVDAPEAVTAAFALLDEKSGVREEVWSPLVVFGPRAKVVAPPLIKLLRSEDAKMVQGAAAVLEAIGPDSTEDAVPFLVDAVKKYADDRSSTCYWATLALGTIPIRKPEHVPPLIELLKTDDDQLNRVAADALAKAPSLTKPAIPALRDCLKKKDERVRLSAGFALALLTDGDEPIDAILAVLETDNVHTRQLAVIKLDQLAARAAKALPRLKTLVKTDPDATVRAAASKAITIIENK